jgi:hypothetical protein
VKTSVILATLALAAPADLGIAADTRIVLRKKGELTECGYEKPAPVCKWNSGQISWEIANDCVDAEQHTVKLDDFVPMTLSPCPDLGDCDSFSEPLGCTLQKVVPKGRTERLECVIPQMPAGCWNYTISIDGVPGIDPEVQVRDPSQLKRFWTWIVGVVLALLAIIFGVQALKRRNSVRRERR